MNKFETSVLEKLDEIKALLSPKRSEEKALEFEDHNFRVSSVDWKKIEVDGEFYLQNPEKDIWEILDGECKGEQLFTWDAAMRETEKAGKKIPTDDELTLLIQTKNDIKNVPLAGYRYSDGTFYSRTTYVFIWSSSRSGASAWGRRLGSGDTTVYRSTGSKAYGFSVRCLKD